MMKKLLFNFNLTSQKCLMILIASFFLSSTLSAQIPTNHKFSYLFTNGSKVNSTPNSLVPDLNNSFISTTDRYNAIGNAAETDSAMAASLTSLLPNDTLIMSLSFWMKMSDFTGIQRILQMYGPNGRGFHLEADSTSIAIKSKVTSTTAATLENRFVCTTDLIADQWHHIVVKTFANASAAALYHYIYIDGVEQSFQFGNTLTTPGEITEFIQQANFIINPTSNYSGKLDDIYFYTELLSDADVTELYNDCTTFSVAITNSSEILAATSGFANYQWEKDGQTISGATNSSYTALSIGTYTCVVTENNCTVTSNAIDIETITSIKDASFNKLNIYPNPTSNIINLEIEEKLNTISLMNITGKTIKVFNAEARHLDISELTAGIYLLELANDEKKSVFKIIKR